MNISKLAGLACGAAFLLGHRAALADISIGTNGATVDFTGFTAAGFTPTPATGQLSSNSWEVLGFSDGNSTFGDTQLTADYTRGASVGNVTTGGIYAFSDDGNVFLGVQPSTDDFTPGTFTARFKNDLTRSIASLKVDYRILARNDQARSSSLNFSWSRDHVTYTPVAALNYASTAAAATAPDWVATARTTTLSTTIAAGAVIYLRWSSDEVSGTGPSDELGIDDIVLTVMPACGDGIVQGAETCDDADTDNTDVCPNTCVAASCGDGFVWAGVEQCDPAASGTVCCSANTCQRTTGNSCSNGNGTCNAGVCVLNNGGGGEGGELGLAGESAGGAAGETQNGGRPGRGGRPGGGAPNAGGPAAGTAGSATAGGPSGGAPSAGTGPTAGAAPTAGAPAGGRTGTAGGSGTGAGGTSGKGGTGNAGTSSKPPAAKPSTDDDEGCGCSVPRSSNHGALWLVAAAGFVTLARRRRQGL